MIKPELYFLIETGFNPYFREQLKELSQDHFYNYKTKKYVYIFSIGDIGKIMEILGEIISFEDQKENIIKLIQLCPPLKERIDIEEWKGKGEFTFEEQPRVFMVGEWQKDPKTGIPKQSFHAIPKENILSVWNIIKKYEIGKFVKVRTITKYLCEILNVGDFNKADGTFDWTRAWGSHRKFYLPRVYYPLKVLQHLKVINYSKVGKIARVKEEITLKQEEN